MKSSIAALEKVLLQQIELYKLVYSFEMDKRGAILERDSRAIEQLSSKQEIMLREIQRHEETRIALVESYQKRERLINRTGELTLRTIAASMDKNASKNLIKIGSDLKELLLKIKALQETNKGLFSDTLEFYKIMLNSLKNGVSIDAGYGKNGREDGKVAKPILFNKTV